MALTAAVTACESAPLRGEQPARSTVTPVRAHRQTWYNDCPFMAYPLHQTHELLSIPPPNGTRLGSVTKVQTRKPPNPQTKRLASEATQFLPTCARPSASSAC